MHRIDADSHVANLFNAGDPGGPRAPTQVDADWLNAVQEEIATMVLTAQSNALTSGAGISLVKGTNSQLRAALNTLFFRPGFASGCGQALPDGVFLEARTDSSGTNAGRQRIILRSAETGTGTGSAIWLTVNARWSITGSNWTKDNAASPAIAMVLMAGALAGPIAYQGASFYSFTGAGPWADSAWVPANARTALPFSASWANTGGVESPGVFYGTVDGDVAIEGTVSLIAGVVTDPIATLPALYRPATTKRFPSGYLSGTRQFCVTTITSAGVITTNSPSGAEVLLDGIRFSRT